MQYISNTDKQKEEMLKAVGVPSFESLISRVPKKLRDFDMQVPAVGDGTLTAEELMSIPIRGGFFLVNKSESPFT